MNYSKMYIAVLDEAPDYMVPTLVAHSVLNAHDYFSLKRPHTYHEWFKTSFRKVVVRVNRREYDRIKMERDYWEGYENTICNGDGSCLVVLPVMSDAVPNVLKYAKLWSPKEFK